MGGPGAGCVGISAHLPLVCFAESVRDAEDELLLPCALRLSGCVCGARHPPGPALPSAPLPALHHPVGGRADQSHPPRLAGLHLPGESAMGEELRGAPERGGPLLPLPSVCHCSLGAGAVHHGGSVGVALLGKGEWMCSCAAVCKHDEHQEGACSSPHVVK